MSVETISFEKVTQRPSVFAKNTVYFVSEDGLSVSLFMSNKTGDALLPVTGSSTGSSQLDPFLLMGANNG